MFLEATVLGDRGRLEDDERETLIGSGVFHMLAISGANIGMLALISLLALRGLRVPLKTRYALTSVLLLLFLTVSGFDVSAERAVLMALLLFAARVWFMDAEPSNIISFSGLLLLAVNPAQFLDPGFILTFALTAAILVGRGLFLPLLHWLPRWTAELLSANVSASLLALPLSLYFFQRYAFSGFFSGLLLAPLAAAITVCGALLLFLVFLPFNAAALALLPAGVFLGLFFKVSDWFYQHLSLSIYRPSPPWGLLAVIGALFYAVSLARLSARRRAAPALLLAALLGYISFPAATYRPGRLEVYFLDVGHGDAEVAVLPNGDALLVDGGGSSFSDFQAGRRLVLPFLLQKRIHVRWAAATHYHPDHAEGLAEIIAILRPEELWLSSAVNGRRLLPAVAGRQAGKNASEKDPARVRARGRRLFHRLPLPARIHRSRRRREQPLHGLTRLGRGRLFPARRRHREASGGGARIRLRRRARRGGPENSPPRLAHLVVRPFPGRGKATAGGDLRSGVQLLRLPERRGGRAPEAAQDPLARHRALGRRHDRPGERGNGDRGLEVAGAGRDDHAPT